ncbi:hypothetical protein GCM10025857_02510 [Alicyclobacillus contaminans]|nr:hypothetical protein GCM10025857_02510 [Alicyclobacillus contaminans]
MSRTWNGEVVWLDRGNGRWSVVILVPETVRKLGGNALVRLSNWRVPLVSRLPRGQVRYRQRIGVHRTAGAWTAGPVYAILAGAGEASSLVRDLAFAT